MSVCEECKERKTVQLSEQAEGWQVRVGMGMGSGGGGGGGGGKGCQAKPANGS